MKTTIGIKISFAFFVLLILFGVIGTSIYSRINNATINLEQIKKEAQTQIKVGNLRFKVTQVLMASNDYIITNKEFYKQEYQKQNALLDKDYQEFIQSDLTNKEKQLAYEIRIDIDSIRIYSERIFSITNPRKSSYAWELMEIMDYRFGNTVNAKTTLIFDGVSERIEEYRTNAEMAKQKIITLVQRAILISLIFSLIIIYLSIVKIARPIKKITKSANLIAKGDYTKRLEVKTHDEIASLADSFNQMCESIQQSQKVLNDSKRLTEAIVATMPVGLLVIDSKGKIMSANNSFYNIFNLVQNPLLYQNIEPMLEELKITEECRNHILAHDHMSDVECSYSNPIRGLRTLNLTLCAIQSTDGKSLLIIDDITDRIQNKQELIKAKEKAEESDRLKSAFLANMSHEIRTPMNGILGFTELLLEPDLNNERKEEYITIVQQCGQRMLSTVNDIIEISKIEAGLIQLNLTETSVNGRIEELFRFFQPEADKKGLKLSLEMLLLHADENITTDQNKLDSILTNLLKNAIKYTDSGTINIGCRQKDQFIEFYVKDTGIGIPVDRKKAIFERFMQADITDTRALNGSGLGLAISKSYIEMLGGKIWVKSREGKGSTFYFNLPIKNKIEKKTVVYNEISFDYERVKPKVKRWKILIAEDDKTSQNFISLIVNDFNAEILKAVTGNETVELCRNTKDLDLILMDIQMPGLNGYEVTHRIRKFNRDVVIIAQTAFAHSGDREKLLEAGCNDYIAKPINKKELLTLIQKYFVI